MAGAGGIDQAYERAHVGLGGDATAELARQDAAFAVGRLASSILLTGGSCRSAGRSAPATR